MAQQSQQLTERNRPSNHSVNRTLQRYRIVEKNGHYETFVTLQQKEINSSWSTPQGTRPAEVSIGTFRTLECADQAGREYAPPQWEANQNRCRRCNEEFYVLKRQHHCRNCGFIVCGSCSKNQWPSSMVPKTYHNKERHLRACKFCQQSYDLFISALLNGNQSHTREIYSKGNVNLWQPYTIRTECYYPIHYAAQSGNLNLVIWLVESMHCSLDVLTGSKKKVIDIAAENRYIDILRWLVVTKNQVISHITDSTTLARALHGALHSLPPPLANIAELNYVNDSNNRLPNPTDAIPLVSVVCVDYSEIDRANTEESKSNQQIVNLNICRTCFTYQIDCVFVPCGHLYSCYDCSQRIKVCPSCGTQIQKHLRTILPN